MSIQDKIHKLVDRTSDPIVLENIYRYLSAALDQPMKSLSDELSDADLKLLHEARAEYRRGETKSHEEILELLRKWDTK